MLVLKKLTTSKKEIRKITSPMPILEMSAVTLSLEETMLKGHEAPSDLENKLVLALKHVIVNFSV